jgi:hypothetical protein
LHLDPQKTPDLLFRGLFFVAGAEILLAFLSPRSARRPQRRRREMKGEIRMSKCETDHLFRIWDFEFCAALFSASSAISAGKVFRFTAEHAETTENKQRKYEEKYFFLRELCGSFLLSRRILAASIAPPPWVWV